MATKGQGFEEAKADWSVNRERNTPSSSGGDDLLEKLRKAVVDSALDARRAFVIFAAFSLYLIITVGSTTHLQLLNGTVFRLPILSVNIPILGFYIVLPFLYLIAHFNLLGELNTLSDDAYRLKRHLKRTEKTLEAPIPFGLARILVQPDDSGLPKGLIYFLAFTVIVLVPPLILLQIQLRFLPYHQEVVTWLHRVIIVIDMVMIMVLWFKFRHEGLRNGDLPKNGQEGKRFSWLEWLQRSFDEAKWSYRNTVDATVCTIIFVTLVLFSFFVATVPDGGMERRLVAALGRICPVCITKLGDDEETYSYLGPHAEAERRMLGLTFYLFESQHSWPWMRRNLIVSHSDLVVRRPPDNFLIYNQGVTRLHRVWDESAIGIDLRGRDLRYADFTKSDLRKADLRGADLEGAMLFKSKLQFADLGDIEVAKIGSCPSPYPKHRRTKGIDGRKLDFCRTNLRSTNLRNADMMAARIWDADFTGANLNHANLANVAIGAAVQPGVDLSKANVRDAEPPEVETCLALFSGAQFLKRPNERDDSIAIALDVEAKLRCLDSARYAASGPHRKPPEKQETLESKPIPIAAQ